MPLLIIIKVIINWITAITVLRTILQTANSSFQLINFLVGFAKGSGIFFLGIIDF
ncbi:MAG: hypothetical protein MRECE_45c002 [Mycoplasmataceae bacterium CE_OT135]|nr:MAG: hypothetical protein MRECE_45c002 [Mycoplasmataceae bacterium CE_OT135]